MSHLTLEGELSEGASDTLNWILLRKRREFMARYRAEAPAPAWEAPTQSASARTKGRVWLGIAVAVLIVAGLVWFVATIAPSPGMATSQESTSISEGASSIIGSALQANPAGFVFQSSGRPVSGSSGWATLQQPDGSEANVTVVVYPSTAASQRYFSRVVSGVKGLPGYADITSDLDSFQRYGQCYGYGEDVDSIAVVNGVCTKGNVYLQVHLVSAIPFTDLEGDLTSIMGALYQGAV